MQKNRALFCAKNIQKRARMADYRLMMSIGFGGVWEIAVLHVVDVVSEGFVDH